ncbi:MAG TPA: RNA 2',3'-cyclic phosphodiesterase [Solirubrobacteraceae bacterium]|nr:RNA 2',3'-cyclic phosphodiesterase [Solirubrobacteraceae bacterium]
MFVAARLPAPVCAELARWARHVPGGGGMRRLDADAMHLTLCFLGDQPLAARDELAAVLGGAAEAVAALGELVVGAPLWLPPRRPRVLAVEIGDPGGGLRELRAALAREIAATIGWSDGRERFRPHVTLARTRPGERRAVALEPTPSLRFACERVALLRSWLEPAGARYEELASVGGW